MAELLGEFRAAVLNAAQQAMQAMELQMVDESFRAIQDFEWRWKGPISDVRPIIDTGNLMESIEIGNVEIMQNMITFSLTWDPIDPDPRARAQHYADLVHDGHSSWFEDENGSLHDYTARPWTFLLMPAEQRDSSQLNTDIGPSVESLPEDGWEAALEAFNRRLSQELSRTMKVIA